MRIALGIIVGIVGAMLTIGIIEWAGHLAYPLPADAALRDPEAGRQSAVAIPTPALLIVAIAWFAGALIGAFVALALARTSIASWTVAGVVALAAVAMVVMIPHPVWMQVSAVVAPLLGGSVAVHWGKRQRARASGNPKL